MPDDQNRQLTFDGDERTTPGESLEYSVAEIKEILHLVESAWSGIGIATAEILAEEHGIDPDRTFWASSSIGLSPLGLAWIDVHFAVHRWRLVRWRPLHQGRGFGFTDGIRER